MTNRQTDESNVLSRRDMTKLLLPAAGLAMGGGGLGAQTVSRPQTTEVQSGIDRGAQLYNVRSFGARGDGHTLDTAAVQQAIDRCTQDGGGVVLVPAGDFLIGTVELKSNVTLHIAAAGKLLGSGDGRHYHAVKQVPLQGDTTLRDGNWALLFASDARNITIEGKGTIDGQGARFRFMNGKPAPSGLSDLERPYHLLLHRCEGIVLRDISLVDSAYHSVRIIQSSRVHIDGLYIHNRVNGNNDGFHFISAQHVTVTNCTVKAQDDACAMFGSCKYVTISNCSFSTRWSVFRFGGGDAENISISNCLLYDIYGCAIKFQGEPGTRFENISFSNLMLQNVTGPISISLNGNKGSAPGAPAVTARNIVFTNLRGNVLAAPPPHLPESDMSNSFRPGERNSCIVLNAVHGAVLEEVTFDNVHLSFAGGGTPEDAAQRDVPQVAGDYFALGVPPAYGMYARQVRGLTLQNVRLRAEKADARPALVLDDVEDMSANALTVDGNTQTELVVRAKNARQILIAAPRVLNSSKTFLELEGAANEVVLVDGGDLSKVGAFVVLQDGATDSAVRFRGIR